MATNILEKFREIIDEEKFTTDEAKYVFNGQYVPRVTHILQYSIYEDYIPKWANYLGFKHLNYEKTLNEAASVGSTTHNYIESFTTKKDLSPDFNSKEKNCINSFLNWWAQITEKNDVEIIAQETTLSCPYFGGTFDMLLKINKKYYLIDFKTSNKVSFKYFMQLAAYKYMLEPMYGIKLSGVMILRLSKTNIKFEETIVDLHTKIGRDFIDDCLNAFFACVTAYQYRKRIESYNLAQFRI